MNEEMQKRLLENADKIMNSIYETAKTATDTASEQLPLLATEYLKFAMAWETMGVVAPILLLVGLYFLWKKWYAKDIAENWTGGGVPTMICASQAVVVFIVMCLNMRGFLLVWFAPKIYLIEAIVELAK